MNDWRSSLTLKKGGLSFRFWAGIWCFLSVVTVEDQGVRIADSREILLVTFVGGESVVNVLPNEALGVFLILGPCSTVL